MHMICLDLLVENEKYATQDKCECDNNPPNDYEPAIVECKFFSENMENKKKKKNYYNLIEQSHLQIHTRLHAKNRKYCNPLTITTM